MDYAFIGPNESKIDLSGCFGISKAQGDLSTERVQMQVTKLSCVSKQGRLFERDINGFVADDKDNSFAVIGDVNSKQDRVAAQAFLSSIVEGVGKAIQQTQTTQQTTPLGGSQSTVTGDAAKYIAAGGASEAASQVTQWYLRQAQGLLPTINVGSGQDIWVVMQDKVELPNWYFKKAKIEKSVFGYFTTLAE
jgi:conjugal transfer pilus assembly protein TraB